MRNYLYIISLIAFILLAPQPVQAFSIRDSGTKIVDILEGTIEWMKKASEEISKAEAAEILFFMLRYANAHNAPPYTIHAATFILLA